jgi:hypothetical protein
MIAIFKANKWYHCVCVQREQSNGTTVYVYRENSQMAPLWMWTEREVKCYHYVCGQREREQSNGATVYVDRESSQMTPLCMFIFRAVKWHSQMVPLCMCTERAVKWYHCVSGQRDQSNDTTVYVDRESSLMVPLCT